MGDIVQLNPLGSTKILCLRTYRPNKYCITHYFYLVEYYITVLQLVQIYMPQTLYYRVTATVVVWV